MWNRAFDPRDAARRAVEETRRAVGDRLVGATLYGSAAGGEFDPRHSDVNLAFVLTVLGPPEIESLRKIHRVWNRLRVVRPILVSREALQRSLDVFPLEYLLVRERHETLYGQDSFAGLAIERDPLRREVERVLRTQELGFVWSYVALADTPSGAKHWLARAGTAVAASVSGLLYLAGEPVPRTRKELVDRCEARFGVDGSALRLVIERASGRRPVEAPQLLGTAQALLSRLIEAAERLDSPTPNP